MLPSCTPRGRPLHANKLSVCQGGKNRYRHCEDTAREESSITGREREPRELNFKTEESYIKHGLSSCSPFGGMHQFSRADAYLDAATLIMGLRWPTSKARLGIKPSA